MRKCLACGHTWLERKGWDKEDRNYCRDCKRAWGVSIVVYEELKRAIISALPPNPPTNWLEVVQYVKTVRGELNRNLPYKPIPIEAAFTLIEDIFNLPRLPRFGF